MIAMDWIEKLKQEPVYTRLLAGLIALVTGTILYFRFWKNFIAENPEAYILAFCVALGSAFLIDRMIVRSRDLFIENPNGKRRVSIVRALIYGALIVTVVGVVVLDRGAEIFVMKNNRAARLVSQYEQKIAEAKQASGLLARENRRVWLRKEIIAAAREDSVQLRASQKELGAISSSNRNRIQEIRRLISAARRDSNYTAVAEFSEQLNEIEAQRVEAQAMFYRPISSRSGKLRGDLAREDSLYHAELNAELARLGLNNDTLTNAGLKDNPIGFILEAAPSIILWLIVFGLFLSAYIVEQKDHEQNRMTQLIEYREPQQITDKPLPENEFNNTKTLEIMMAQMAERFGLAQQNQIKPKREPFKRGDYKDAKEWLTFMIYSGKYQARYENALDGDFAAACRHAGIKHGKNEDGTKSKRSSLFRHVQDTMKAKDRATPEKIAEVLARLSRFNEEPDKAVSKVVLDLQAEITDNNAQIEPTNGVHT